MDPELKIIPSNLFDSDSPQAIMSSLQSDYSQISRQSCLRSDLHVPQPHYSNCPNEISPTPDWSHTSSLLSVRASMVANSIAMGTGSNGFPHHFCPLPALTSTTERQKDIRDWTVARLLAFWHRNTFPSHIHRICSSILTLQWHNLLSYPRSETQALRMSVILDMALRFGGTGFSATTFYLLPRQQGDYSSSIRRLSGNPSCPKSTATFSRPICPSPASYAAPPPTPPQHTQSLLNHLTHVLPPHKIHSTNSSAVKPFKRLSKSPS